MRCLFQATHFLFVDEEVLSAGAVCFVCRLFACCCFVLVLSQWLLSKQLLFCRLKPNLSCLFSDLNDFWSPSRIDYR
jgi:hypothetical protein